MTKIRLKIAIKCLKNGQNDLKFRHNMHYGDSNHFLKFCQNLSKNHDFLAKNPYFFKLYGSISVFKFSTEKLSSPWKMV